MGSMAKIGDFFLFFSLLVSSAQGVVVGNKEPIALGSRHSSAAKIMPWEYVKVVILLLESSLLNICEPFGLWHLLSGRWIGWSLPMRSCLSM